MNRVSGLGRSSRRCNRRMFLTGSTDLACGVLSLPAVASAQFDQTQVALVWEAAGSEETPLLQPDGVAVAPDGSISVVNTKANQIVVLSPDGEFVEAWGGPGSGPGQFRFTDAFGSFLGDINFDADGNCYVFDTFNLRVQKFSPDHDFLLEVTGESADAPFIDNVAGGIDATNGLLYVADFSDQVRVFDLEGNFLRKFGSNGVEDGQFFWPFDVLPAADGSIYVSEIKGKRAQQFDSEGNFVRRVTEAELGTVGDVYYMALDANDNLFLVDSANLTIRIYDPDAAFLGAINEVPDYGRIGLPAGLSFDPEGHLIVADSFEHRVLKLKLPAL